MPRYRNNSDTEYYGKFGEFIRPGEEKDLKIYLEPDGTNLIEISDEPVQYPIEQDILIKKEDFIDGTYVFEIPYGEQDHFSLRISPVIYNPGTVNPLDIYDYLFVQYNKDNTPKVRLYSEIIIEKLYGVYKRLIFTYDRTLNDLDFVIHIQVIKDQTT